MDRRTKTCRTERQLDSAIKRECYAIRLPGPYLVTRYAQGRVIGSSLED